MKKEKSPSDSAAECEEKGGFDNFTKWVLRLTAIYLIFFVVYMIIFSCILMITKIPSESMKSTIMTGDIVIATRFGVDADEIKRYDILIFTLPNEPNTTYIKRVIGLPGETVEVKNGKVYVDGVEMDDSFTNGPMNRRGDGVYPVPEGCYFFLGDNRNQSKDSRFWKEKYIPIENIQAKAWYIVYPFNRAGHIE